MIDFKLGSDGDLLIDEGGDIEITDSIVQAVSIRLKWFLDEWRLGPTLGMPYFDELFVKNPDFEQIKRTISDAIMGVDGVTQINSISIKTNAEMRKAVISFSFSADETTYEKEVILHA